MIKQTQIQEDNLQVFKKGLVKALCILFSNLKFEIQWKLASNSWPKTDTIKKTHQETRKPPRFQPSPSLRGGRGHGHTHGTQHCSEWLCLQNGQEARPRSPSWNATCLPGLHPGNPHTVGPAAEAHHSTSWVRLEGELGTEIWALNMWVMCWGGEGEEWNYTLREPQKMLHNGSLLFTVCRFSTATIK